MAKKKYDLITDLYAETVKEVTASPENWMSFLCSACRNFRLPFDEQILIYAQRPEASAVLPMKVWNALLVLFFVVGVVKTMPFWFCFLSWAW